MNNKEKKQLLKILALWLDDFEDSSINVLVLPYVDKLLENQFLIEILIRWKQSYDISKKYRVNKIYTAMNEMSKSIDTDHQKIRRTTLYSDILREFFICQRENELTPNHWRIKDGKKD